MTDNKTPADSSRGKNNQSSNQQNKSGSQQNKSGSQQNKSGSQQNKSQSNQAKSNPSDGSRSGSQRSRSGGSRSGSQRSRSGRSGSSKSAQGGSGQNKSNQGRQSGVTSQRSGSSHRRKSGTRRADVTKQGQVQHVPNYSPQYDIRNLRSLGRDVNNEDIPYGRTGSKTIQNSLKVISLGGLCEIGKNMTVYEYGNDMVIVDVGQAFPEEHQPGIDSVIPDMSYVIQNKNKLRGIFLTHGHEDHIGSIAWLMKEVNCPVFGLPLTIELVKNKMEEKGLKNKLNLLQKASCGPMYRAGVFQVEFVHVNHSIADAASIALHTPEGIVVHSGDFKIDYTPVSGKPADLARFAELGKEGVLLFVGESTNVERPGFTPSETKVAAAFAKHFENAEGRVIVATFSSNVSRVQQIISAAEQFGRKVALVGRSMLNVFKAADSLGYIHMKKDTLIEIRDIDRYPDDKVCIITTGSQSEAMAALTRMAYSEHRNVEIGSKDTVIISATPIPGNEKPIYRVINELYKRRATVVYSDLSDIHVSGHAYREEHKLLHTLLKPQYFLPGHGEYRHLYLHAELAHELGQPWDSIYILNNGDIFECTTKQAHIAGYVNASAILIDGATTSKIDHQILDQRRELADDGVVSVTIAVDDQRGQLAGDPAIQSSGFISATEFADMANEVTRKVQSYVDKHDGGRKLSDSLQTAAFRDQLQRVLFNKTRRRPVLLINAIPVRK